MAKGELLRIVYNDSNVTYFTSSGPIYRKFVKDRKGEEYVEYRDAQEKLLGTAQEIGFPDGSRRVQFLDRYYNEVAFAELAYGLLGAEFIAFYRADDRVTIQAKRYVSKEELERLTRKDPVDTPVHSEPASVGKGCLTTGLGWVLIIAAIFLCGIFAKLLTEEFAHLHTRAYDLLNVVWFAATRLPCVIAAGLCVIFLRLPKGIGKGAVVFWAILVVLTVVPFYFVGIQLDRMLQPYGLGIEGWNNVKIFLLCFVPGVAYLLALNFIMLFVKKSPNRAHFAALVHRAGKIYAVLAGILIFVSRITAAYVWQFETDFSSGMFFAFRMIWYAILVGGINRALQVGVEEI